MVRNTFARALQMRGEIFRPKSEKIERGIADKPLFRDYLIYIRNRVFGNIS